MDLEDILLTLAIGAAALIALVLVVMWTDIRPRLLSLAALLGFGAAFIERLTPQ